MLNSRYDALLMQNEQLKQELNSQNSFLKEKTYEVIFIKF